MKSKIDIDILKEFIEGDIHDIYLFIKKTIYKDMYLTIHDYCFKDLREDDSIEVFKRAILKDYEMQNSLNKSLKVTDGKFFDEYLLRCIVGNLHDRFPDRIEFNQESENLKKEIREIINQKSHKDVININNLSLLTGLIKDRFNGQDMVNINELDKYLKELTSYSQPKNQEITFTDYLNELISNRKITLNQLGIDSFIKKGIYEISLGKIPTKNQLIMLSISLDLKKEEIDKLFYLAKLRVKDSSNSNMYSFEEDNKRDKLIIHWLDNLESLKDIARNQNKNVIQLLNKILKESNFEELK